MGKEEEEGGITGCYVMAGERGGGRMRKGEMD
jgi:hypothetical protein